MMRFYELFLFCNYHIKIQMLLTLANTEQAIQRQYFISNIWTSNFSQEKNDETSQMLKINLYMFLKDIKDSYL